MRISLPPAWAFSLRTFGAAVTALYVAYRLELASPYSAATTVFIVSSPLQGAVLSKSIWRILGTVIGGLAAIVLMALAAQAPVLFLVGFALWLGLCTAISTTLRHFRAYGAVLAGYTIALIGFAAIDDPNRLFELALARCAVVSVGVVVAGLFASLLHPTQGFRDLRFGIRSAGADVARRLALLIQMPERMTGPRAARIADIFALDALIEYAGVETPAFRRNTTALHEMLTELSGVLAGESALAHCLARLRAALPADSGVHAMCAQLSTSLERLAEAFESGSAELLARAEEVDALREPARLALIHENADEAALGLRTADHLGMMLSELVHVARQTALLRAGKSPVSEQHFAFYVDRRAAIRNGVRAVLTILLSGAFWMATAWTGGPSMFAMVGPMCALLANFPSPGKASVDFVIGTTLSAVAGFVYVFAVLPYIDGFPLLVVTLAPFVLPALHSSVTSERRGIATAYLTFFTTLIALTNPMRFNPVAYLDSALAFVIGACFGVLAFRILLPPNPERDIAHLRRELRQEVIALTRLSTPPDRRVWEHLQQQRIVRLGSRISPDRPEHAAWQEDAFASILLGRAILRIRDLLGVPTVGGPAREAGKEGLAAFDSQASSEELTAAVRASERKIAKGKPTLEERMLAGSLLEIAEEIEAHPDFFERAHHAG